MRVPDNGGAVSDVGLPNSRRRVLLVEDEPALREMARRMLASEDLDLTIAPDGAEAIELARAADAHVDLLLTDVVMPGMYGPELAHHLRTLHPELRVLYMSGYSGGVRGPHGILEADDLLIEKPFTRAALIRSIRNALQRDEPPSWDSVVPAEGRTSVLRVEVEGESTA
jgi:CheY-like chemotaxis protein